MFGGSCFSGVIFSNMGIGDSILFVWTKDGWISIGMVWIRETAEHFDGVVWGWKVEAVVSTQRCTMDVYIASTFFATLGEIGVKNL